MRVFSKKCNGVCAAAIFFSALFGNVVHSASLRECLGWVVGAPEVDGATIGCNNFATTIHSGESICGIIVVPAADGQYMQCGNPSANDDGSRGGISATLNGMTYGSCSNAAPCTLPSLPSSPEGSKACVGSGIDELVIQDIAGVSRSTSSNAALYCGQLVTYTPDADGVSYAQAVAARDSATVKLPNNEGDAYFNACTTGSATCHIK